MSILLDAVSRAKQEHPGEVIDPVLTPRPNIQPPVQDKRWFYIAIIVLLCVLVAAVVWRLLVPANSHSVVVAETPNSAPQVTSNARQANAAAPAVALAGKVTLPMAKPLPAKPAPQAEIYQPQASPISPVTQQTTVSASQAAPKPVADNEPIILGAGANDKGRAMLQQLRDGETDANAAQRQGRPQTAAQPVNNSQTASSDVNDELLNRFKAALSEVERRNALTDTDPAVDAPAQPAKPVNYPSYGELPASLQLQVPEFNITAHLYATNPSKRWINVDGKELQQGDKIKQKLTIKEIRANDVVLSIQGQDFRVPAI